MRRKNSGTDGSENSLGHLARKPSRSDDIEEKADRLAPLEEQKNIEATGEGMVADDTIRVDTEALKPRGGFLDDGGREPGLFRLPPVVIAGFGLLIVYTIFVAILIAVG